MGWRIAFLVTVLALLFVVRAKIPLENILLAIGIIVSIQAFFWILRRIDDWLM